MPGEMGQMKEFRCSICGYSNDPNYYAMRKVGKRWYHLICIEKKEKSE
jgi:hypothetical protein